MGIKTFSSGWEWLFQILFPGGFSTLTYVGSIAIIGLLIYSLSQILGKKEEDSWFKIRIRILFAGFIFMGALFSPLFTGIFLVYLIWTGFQILKTSPTLHTARRVTLVTLNLGGALLILLLGGFISFFWRNLLVLYTLIGIGLGGFLLSLTQVRNFLVEKQINMGRNFTSEKHTKIHIGKFARYQLLILIICGSLFCLTGFVRPIQSPPADYTPSGNMSLKVASYNIRLGTASENNNYDNWGERKDEIASYIDNFDADFILLQEAYRFQISYLIRNLETKDYAYTGAGREDGVLGGEHSAVVYDTTRFQLITGGSFWLSDYPSIPKKTWEAGSLRICTWGRFKEIETGNQIVVSSVHYDFGPEFREKASKLINERLPIVSGSVPVILGGDFNLRNDSSGYEFLENYGEKPLWNSYYQLHGNEPQTINSFNRFDLDYPQTGKIIDFIFVSSEITSNTCVIPQETYIAPDGLPHYYSDHFPIILECIV